MTTEELLYAVRAVIATLEIEPCPRCGGDGSLNRWDACATCGGTGEIVVGRILPEALRGLREAAAKQ